MPERDAKAYLEPQRTVWLEADRVHRKMINIACNWFQAELEKEKNRLHREMQERFAEDMRRTGQSVKDAFDAYVSVSDGVHPALTSETEAVQ